MNEPERAKRARVRSLPLVVVLIAHEESRTDILQAMRGSAELIFCSTSAEAEHLLAAHTPAAFLANARRGDGRAVRDLVARLSFESPDLPVLALGDSPERALSFLKSWAGGAGSVHPGPDLARQVAAHILRARHRVQRRTLGAAIAMQLPFPAQDVVRRAIEDGDRPQTVRQLAQAIGVPRKTMDRRLSRTIPLSARQLISWGRLLALAMQIEDSNATIDAMAYELQFSSPSALRNLMQRYAGLTPTELRRRGGSVHLAAQLTAALGLNGGGTASGERGPRLGERGG